MNIKTHIKNEIFPFYGMFQSRNSKEIYLMQNAKVIWLTGFSGSGKTVLAKLLEQKLFKLNYFCQILDGDNVRSGLNKNLSFTEEDRHENIRRVAEVAKLFLNSGIITICAFISPTKEIRQMASYIIGTEDFLEIFVNTPLEICEQRDPKGLYKRARAGELKNFTGISASYEPPENPFLSVDNTEPDLDMTINQILKKLLPEISFKPEQTIVEGN